MIIARKEIVEMAKRFKVMFRIEDIFLKQSIRDAANKCGVELQEEYKDGVAYIFIKDAEDKESFERFLVACLDNPTKKIGFFKERIWGVRVSCVTDQI